MGLRQSLGLFLAPMTEAHAWSASGFAFAIALQVLLNGLTQPLWGQIADRHRRAAGHHGGRAAAGGRPRSAWRCRTSLAVFTFFAGSSWASRSRPPACR